MSRGFVATPSGGTWNAQPYRTAPSIPATLNGINEAGMLAGTYYPDGVEGRPSGFTLSSLGATPLTHPAPDRQLSPWVDGLDELGRPFGHMIIDHTSADPTECGGHGHLHGTQCHCDSGYTQDPDDPGMCIAA